MPHAIKRVSDHYSIGYKRDTDSEQFVIVTDNKHESNMKIPAAVMKWAKDPGINFSYDDGIELLSVLLDE